jgi:DNA invertase Pin-like site-specific DNA recombinase
MPGVSGGQLATKAVMYARVSSREQEREGYSIPAQRKLLSQYAAARGFQVARVFVDVESAKNPGRKEFGNMLRLLEGDSACRVVLVEKTDRLYRNRTDSLTFEELIEKRGVEVHLVKEGRVIAKNSRSQDKFMHDIHVAVARNYSENLKEEVRKGMREKAEQGVYPGRAPFGYRNNTITRTIEVAPGKAPVLQRIFELYGTGNHSLDSLRKALWAETGVRLSRSYLETILKNRFYLGQFAWDGTEYKGSHPALIDAATFERVQDVFAGHNKPRYRKHQFAFAGLLTCAHDGCTVTTESHKGKYVYYRCSYGRGKCDLPYMREQEVSERLADVLKNIHVPENVVQAIVDSIEADRERSESRRREQLTGVKQRLTLLRTHMDQMYEDKLDGRIDEEFWRRKMREWRAQEAELQNTVDRLCRPVTSDRVMTARRILELANKAHFLYLTRNSAERGQLLKSVLLNCATDGVSLWPNYRKPFDLIFRRAKNKEWSGREDLNLRPPGPEKATEALCCCPA